MSDIDQDRIARAVREILEAIGEDPDREGLKGTPDRVARFYAELFGPPAQEPAEVVRTSFTEEYSEIVLVRDIPFAAMCEHHLLPFSGVAHVGYIPQGATVLGISKLARAVDAFARRPQIQERLTNQVADLLVEVAKPMGVVVVIEAMHTCMTLRGARKPGSTVVTSALRGVFLSESAARAEALTLIHGGRAL